MDKKINAEALETFLVDVLKFTSEEVAKLYNEAGELNDFTLITKRDSDRIAKLNKVVTDQRGKVFKEGAESVEKAIREKYDVDSEVKLIGVDLFDHIIETKLADVKAPDGDIMKNPDVIRLISSHAKDKKNWEKDLQAKLEAKEKEISEANLFKEIESLGLAEFDKLLPILPKDPLKAQRQKNDLLIAELKKYKYQKDGESPVVLKPDGTVLQDEHGHPILFSSHIKSIAEKSFEFKAAEDRNSPGNKDSGGSGTTKIRKPKDNAEYLEMMRDNSLTQVEKIGIMKLHTSKT